MTKVLPVDPADLFHLVGCRSLCVPGAPWLGVCWWGEEGCHCHSDAPLVSQLVTLITGRKGRGGTSPVDPPHCQRQLKEWRWQAGELGTAPERSLGVVSDSNFKCGIIM